MQTMTQAIMQTAIEAMKAVVKAKAVARYKVGARHKDKPSKHGIKIRRLTLKQHIIDWSATKKY